MVFVEYHRKSSISRAQEALAAKLSAIFVVTVMVFGKFRSRRGTYHTLEQHLLVSDLTWRGYIRYILDHIPSIWESLTKWLGKCPLFYTEKDFSVISWYNLTCQSLIFNWNICNPTARYHQLQWKRRRLTAVLENNIIIY